MIFLTGVLLLALAQGEDIFTKFEISPPVYEGNNVLKNTDFSDIVENKQLKRGIGGKTDLGMKSPLKYSSPAFHFNDDFKAIQKDFYNIIPYGGFPAYPHISVYGEKGQISYPKLEYTNGAFTFPLDSYKPYFGVKRPIETTSSHAYGSLETEVKKAHINSVKIKHPKYPGGFQTTMYGFNKGHSKKVSPNHFDSYERVSVYSKDKLHLLPERFKNDLNLSAPPYLQPLKPAIPIPGKLGLKKITELPISETIPGVPIPASPILSGIYKPPMKTDIKLAHLKAVELHQPASPTVLTDLKKFKKIKKVHPVIRRETVTEGLFPSQVSKVEAVITAPIKINFDNDFNDVYKSFDYDGNAVGQHYFTTEYENKNDAFSNLFLSTKFS